MTRKNLGYVELEWTCPSCSASNPGTRKTCATCGKAMPEDMKFELPAQQQLDTSAETAARAEAGPDIHCPYCGTRNPADAKTCKQCGGDLAQGTKRDQEQVLGALQVGPLPDVACPHCGASNPATATKCAKCGGVLAGPKPEPEPEPPAPQRKFPIWLIAVIILGLLGCCVGGLLLSRGSAETVALVKNVEWAYAIEFQELGPVTYEAWRDQVPSSARLGGCERKVRRTVADPVPGAMEVCGTPYVVDTGTGKGRVQQDCKYLVSDDWCRYTVNEWRPAGQKIAKGTDFSPNWPVLNLGSGQREHVRSETYKVVLDADGKQYVFAPRTLDEFRQFRIGSKWIVQTNAFGGVTGVVPAK